jgi:hypothetical protein
MERLSFQRRFLKGENMIELNLETHNKQEEVVKEYLQNNVSDTLADKINNGVQIVKDNKTLINKKTLSGFMKYACNQAREQSEKGSNCACIEDKVVFGWAIHYFEEETIEEQLFNEDGTEFKVETKKTETLKVEVKQKPKPEKEQATLFDLFNLNSNEKQTEIEEAEKLDEDIEEDVEEDIEEDIEELKPNIQTINNRQIDISTGEVISKENQTFDKFQLKTISALLNGKVVLK